MSDWVNIVASGGVGLISALIGGGAVLKVAQIQAEASRRESLRQLWSGFIDSARDCLERNGEEDIASRHIPPRYDEQAEAFDEDIMQYRTSLAALRKLDQLRLVENRHDALEAGQQLIESARAVDGEAYKAQLDTLMEILRGN